MIWILNAALFVIALLTNSVTAQIEPTTSTTQQTTTRESKEEGPCTVDPCNGGGTCRIVDNQEGFVCFCKTGNLGKYCLSRRNDFDCLQAFNVTSGNPDPNDFTYVTGESATITFTFNCTDYTKGEDGISDPWGRPGRRFSYLSVNLLIPTTNSTEVLRVFRISHYGERLVSRPRPRQDIKKYGIKAKDFLEANILTLDIPVINTTLNGTLISWHGTPDFGKIGPILVTCCSLENIPTHFKKSERKGHLDCYKGVTINCKEGNMFQQESYLPSLDVKCTADSKWEYPSDLECRDVATFDFSNKNQVLKSGKRVVFVCDAANSQSVVLNKENETILVENTLTLTPEHNGMEASCTKLNGSEKGVVEKRARLNVWYPPVLDVGYVGNYSLDERSSGHVIIYFHANPRVDTNDGQVYVRGTRKQRLKNFYVTGVASNTLHKLVVDFIKVKKSDFGTYTLVAKSPKFLQNPLIQKFTIGRAPSSRFSPAADRSESATEGPSVLVICLASILGVCFIAIIVLAVLYARNKSKQPKIQEETKDAGADNAGIYNEPDFGEYENLEVADRPAVRQEAEYVNSRL